MRTLLKLFVASLFWDCAIWMVDGFLGFIPWYIILSPSLLLITGFLGFVMFLGFCAVLVLFDLEEYKRETNEIYSAILGGE